MPRETLTHLLDLSIPLQFIYGNGEIAVLEQIAGKDLATVPEQYRPVIRWTRNSFVLNTRDYWLAGPKHSPSGFPG
jgi:hypothetical protein